MLSPKDLLDRAAAAAEAAAHYLRAVPRPEPSGWTAKGPSDFVTEVDRTAERIISQALLDGNPGRLMGEELSPDTSLEGLVWIVDPLDGTTNFLHGYPAYAVSIAAAVDGSVVAGVVLDVSRDRLYRASVGGGAWCGTERLAVSRIAQPAHALIGTGFPFKNPDRLPEYLRQFSRILTATSGIRRAGSAALDLADVAQGRLDGFWELQLAPWDIAAGLVLVREAGGVVTDLAGLPREVGHGAVVAGNREVHRWLLDTVPAG